MQDTSAPADQLQLLMDYTVFHLGVYITLAAAVAGAGTIRNISHWTLRVTVVGFVIAGAAGGIIAGSIPNYGTWKDFTTACHGPWDTQWFTYETLARIEHGAFWIGILFPVIALVACKENPFLKSKK